MAKKKENYLDYIPLKSEKIDWRKREDGLTQLIIYRDSLLDKIVRKLFFTSDKYVVDLDSLGSFVWDSIDGKKSVYEISKLVKAEFGEDAEPIYDRLIEYMIILKNNKFIKLT
ncbi:MAG: PqqD family protein [Clostridiaceae bacterium]|nr:PqqD family protein [Clostridiaceae bacterium]MBW4859171.1 PqqD family protein [Clostridiaceae bacterium]MBW4868667.1 PqqD family protein [Clostridiaceae bacterium]